MATFLGERKESSKASQGPPQEKNSPAFLSPAKSKSQYGLPKRIRDLLTPCADNAPHRHYESDGA
jgi:hypothetical protein